MKEFSVFVITAAACVFFLTGCGVASDSTSSVEPDAPHPGTECGILRGCGKIPF